jgi:MFS family permease
LVFIRPDYGLNNFQAVAISAGFSMAYGLGQLPSGWLADRLGRRIFLAIGILGVAVMGFLVGLSHIYVITLIFLIIMGIAGGGYHPSAAPMISASVEPNQRGRLLGVHAIGGSSSFFLAPLIAAAVAAFWGWRAAFIVLAAFTAIFGVLFFWFLRKHLASEKTERLSSSRVAAPEPLPVPGQKRRLILFLVLVVLAGGMTQGIAPLLPLYFVDGLHLSQAFAASMVSVSSVAGLWAAVAGGYLSDRIGRMPVIFFTFLLGGVIIFLYGQLPWGIGFGTLLFFSGVFSYMRMPVAESFIMGLTTPARRSTIYGIYFATTQEASSVLSLLVGWLTSTYGYIFTFNLTAAVVVGASLVAGIYLWKKE